LSARAVAVECLDAKGKVLRGTELDAGGDDPVDAEEREERKAEKLAAKDRRELAALLGAYGDRINQAFDKGSEATGRGHEQLVALVDVLTGHLTAAIVSLNHVSNRLAKATIDGGGGGSSDNDAMVAQIIGAAAAKFLAPAGASAAPDKKQPSTNGKG
jgi:hypothetical protein